MSIICTLDIETVPLELEEMTATQISELEKRAEAYSQNHPEFTPERAKLFLAGTSPFFGRILVLCFDLYNEITKLHKTQSLAAPTLESEKDLLIEFFNIVNKLPTKNTIFVHYNGLTFDIPFIIKRAVKHSVSIKNEAFLNLRKYSYQPHLDLKEWLANWSYQSSISLDLACDFLGIATPKDGEIKGQDVYEAFKKGKLNQIEEYCLKDIKATFQVYEKIKAYI